MDANPTNHRILVLNNSDYTPPKSIDTKTWIIHKDDLNKRISICLEELLLRWLFKWKHELKPSKTMVQSEINLDVKKEKMHEEIQSICTEISLEKAGVIPTDVKNYLFR